MKSYLKILGIQFTVLILGAILFEKFIGLPEWLSFVIIGLVFFEIYFAIQIIGSINISSDEVSSDGIAGARLCGILICSVLLSFILGIYIYMFIDILMALMGVLLLIIKRKIIKSFFFENKWKREFWIVYLGCIFLLCGSFSIFECLDIAPNVALSGLPRIVAIGIWTVVVITTLPPNTFMAKFATNNFKRFENYK